MKAELKRLLIPDFPSNDMPFEPDTPEDFGIGAVAFIGPADSEDMEAFEFVWCTPSWLARELRGSSLPRLRAHAVTRVWTADGLEELENVLRALCEQAEGPDWGTVAARLLRWLEWEMAFGYDAALDAGERYA